MMDVSAALSAEIIFFPRQEMTFILSMWNVEIRDLYVLPEQSLI